MGSVLLTVTWKTLDWQNNLSKQTIPLTHLNHSKVRTWRKSRHTFSPEAVLKDPEKNPLVLAGVHGLLKSPMTTLWVGGWKWYSMMSPTLAVTESGVKISPFWPTSIRIVAAYVWVVKVMVVRKVSRCMLTAETVQGLRGNFRGIQGVGSWQTSSCGQRGTEKNRKRMWRKKKEILNAGRSSIRYQMH